MGVTTHGLGGRSLARRAGLLLTIPALALALTLGGCRGAGAHNTNSNTPVTQSSGSGSTSASATSTSGGNNNAALQQLENTDSQNQTDQQQLNGAGNNAGVDFSTQDNPLNP